MRSLPFTDLPAGIAFVVALIVFAAVQVVSSLGTFRGGGWRNRRARGLDRGSLLVVVITSGLAIGVASVLAYKVHPATIAPGDIVVRYVVFIVGLVAIVGGSAFRQWAVITLGASFTFDVRVADDQRVITNGPYRFVRHPSYTGLILAYIGLGLAYGDWLCLAILSILPTAGLVYRIGVEEAALRSRLGAEYERFAAGRKRLLPGIW